MDSRFGRSGNGNEPRYSNRGYSRSRSRSRERSRDRGGFRRRNSRSRSRERSSQYRQNHSPDRDLYRDLINEDYSEDQRTYSSRNNFDHRQNRSEENYHNRDEDNYNQRDEDNYDNEREHRMRNYDRETRDRNYDDYDRGTERSSRGSDYRQHNNGNSSNNRDRDRDRDRGGRRYSSEEDSDATDEGQIRHRHQRSTEALNNIILFGLKKHITEADIMGELIKVNMEPSSIRVMRKQPTGASRCFAFVEFNTVEEARHWMDLTQGVLQLGDNRVSMQYSITRISDWTCVKCGASNFKRRIQCFMCNSSRAESENALSGAGEGIDEVSRILTKKIMLRNLDALTNEEGVLTALQEHLPDLAKTVSKVLISRDTLTHASRGICYLHFDTLVDSMNVYNGLTSLDPPLELDDRSVAISYCADAETRKTFPNDSSASASETGGGGSIAGVPPSGSTGNYTLADVPRLAEYSASLYSSNPAEHAHYVQYYTDYYTAEITKNNADAQLTEANSGAAVALSAMQRKQKKNNMREILATAAAPAAPGLPVQGIIAPRGNDGKVYPTPDVSKYQYDETSGYYYDHTTGLYYDAHSQYYYNNETGAYLYWDQRRSTYVLATPASTQAALQEVIAAAEQKEEEAKKAKEKEKDKEGGKHDKVKVAKKIVKDMEKWAKQLNQKKDYTVVATPQPILEGSEVPSTSRGPQGAYADVGFSILEKKERSKTNEFVPLSGPPAINKLVNAYGGASDSEEESASGSQNARGSVAAVAGAGGGSGAVTDEADYVDFQKLTCLLCKRAFQSLDILQKHLKMSNLHKENLAKLTQNSEGSGIDLGASYRDRAKERRLKYGESDLPPPNRSRERFEQEIKTLQTRQKESTASAPAMPISSSNVGSRLMQKMGWSEGQGLGRKNQGRTQIIEAEGRNHNVGLGNQAGKMIPGNDYKSYIKKMMKQRYENA